MAILKKGIGPCFLLLVLMSLGMRADAGDYLALMSQYIKLGDDFPIHVKIFGLVSGETETVAAQLIEKVKDAETVITSVAGQVKSDKPDLYLKLKIPESLIRYTYYVRVSGSGAFKFKNETYVYGQRPQFPVFVQFDKPVYKPGDHVNYRVFGISKNLDQLFMYFNLHIFDPKGHKIVEVNNAEAKPVYEGVLQLAEETFYGNWKIEVIPKAITIRKTRKEEEHENEQKINNKIATCEKKDTDKCYNSLLKLIEKNTDVKTVFENPDLITDRNILSSMAKREYFKVQEYVLPNFFVTLDVPEFYIIGDKPLSGKLNVKYPTNRPVEGYAEITISLSYTYGFFGPKSVSMSKTITGTWDFTLPNELLDRLTGCSKTSTLRVEASVIETVTGTKQVADPVFIRMYESPYKLEFSDKMSANFMPGFPYNVLVRVSKQDGSTATEVDGEKVKITATFFAKTTFNTTAQTCPNEAKYDDYKINAPFEQGYTIMMKPKEYKIKNGRIQIDNLCVPKAATTGTIQAEFDCECIKKDISQFHTLNQQFLKIEAEAGDLTVGGRVILRVKFSSANIGGNILVIAKNRIVDYGSFYIDDNQSKSALFVLLLTRDMAPSASILAYVVYNQELVVDRINLAIENIYENQVTPAFKPSDEVKPQSDVKLIVKADPDSLACVLLQDSRVRALGTDNDITQERVERALGGWYFPLFYRSNWGRIWPWSNPADDSYDQLSEAGVVFVTSLDIFRHFLRAKEPLRRKMAKAKSAQGGQPEGLIRTKFPETWMWQCERVGKSGKAVLPSVVPDTITKWQANAFALNAQSGLGIAPQTADLIGNLNFYVKVELPFKVVQNELIILSPLVFNYLDKDLNVLVTFANTDGQFQGVELNEDGTTTEIAGALTRCILAKANSVTPVFFHFKPLIANDQMKVDVKIEAKSENIFDQVIKYLTVKAEGKEMSVNKVFLISHKTTQTTTESTNIVYPEQTVPGSEWMRLAAVGDLFALTTKNFDRLLRLPYGCGEQNLINFVPAIMVARYLAITKRFTPALQQKVENIIRTGYMRQLLFQRKDGSFSAFGQADKAGSSWLTAFVAKSFAQASEVETDTNVKIVPDEVEKAVRYLVENQVNDGSYLETGRVIHKRMQGGTAKSTYSLTAYILIALAEVKQSGILAGLPIISALDTSIASAKSYLSSSFPTEITDYQAALTALANLDDETALNALKNSENKTEEGGMLYWKHPSRTSQVEIAAYALMVYIRKGAPIETSVSILNWLIKQMTSNGGFYSTQDTVVGLQALEEIAAKIYTQDVDMQIQITAKRDGNEIATESFNLDSEKHDVFQFKDVKDKVDEVNIIADGTGLALVMVQSHFNVKVDPIQPSYFLSVETKDESLKGYIVNVCTRYLLTSEESGMAVLSIPAVTGYKPKVDAISAATSKRVDIKDGAAMIYFDEISSKENVCVSVEMTRIFPAAAWKEADVEVYSYYEPEQNAMVSYIPEYLKNLNICKVCGEECGCGKDSKVLAMAKCNA